MASLWYPEGEFTAPLLHRLRILFCLTVWCLQTDTVLCADVERADPAPQEVKAATFPAIDGPALEESATIKTPRTKREETTREEATRESIDDPASSGKVPNEEGNAESQNRSEQRPLFVWSANPLRATFPSMRELPQSDPVARTPGIQAVSGAESMLDGLGGVPAFIGSGIQAARLPSFRRRIQFGPITIRPTYSASLSFGASFGSFKNTGTQAGQTAHDPDRGRFSSSGNQAGEDAYQSVNAGLQLILGEPATGHFLTVDYGAAYRYFINSSDENITGNTERQPIDQGLSMLGRMDFPKLKLGLGVSFASLSGTNRDFGRGVNRQLLAASLTSSYPLTPKTSLNWTLSVPVSQVSGGIDSTGFASTNSLSHQFSPKLNGGIGYTYGFQRQEISDLDPSNLGGNLADEGSSQTFKQLFIQGSFLPSSRISLSGSVGADFRDAGDSTIVNPTFGVSAGWAFRDGTSLSLSGAEIIQSSASRLGENFISTSVALGASQRLGRRMNLGVSIGYEHADYYSVHSGEASARRDDLFSASTGLNFNLSQRWAASMSYGYANNRSSTDGFISSSGRVQVSYTF